MNRSTVIVAVGCSALVAGSIIWGSMSVAEAIRDADLGAPLGNETAKSVPSASGRSPHEPERPLRHRRQETASQRPTPEHGSRPAPQVRLTQDVFEQRWMDEGRVAEARDRCWSIHDRPPANVNFLVTLEEDGSVSDIENTGVFERAGSEPLLALHACLADIVRAMRFDSSAAGRSEIQINRDW